MAPPCPSLGISLSPSSSGRWNIQQSRESITALREMCELMLTQSQTASWGGRDPCWRKRKNLSGFYFSFHLYLFCLFLVFILSFFFVCLSFSFLFSFVFLFLFSFFIFLLFFTFLIFFLSLFWVLSSFYHGALICRFG